MDKVSDLIDRQAAIDAFGLSEKTRKYGGDHSGYDTMMLYEIQDVLEGLPSAQPETHGKRTETHACDCISREAAIEALRDEFKRTPTNAIRAMDTIKNLPPAQPEQEILSWLLAYHIKSFELHGRYMPHEVIGWLVHDFANAYQKEGDG